MDASTTQFLGESYHHGGVICGGACCEVVGCNASGTVCGAGGSQYQSKSLALNSELFTVKNAIATGTAVQQTATPATVMPSISTTGMRKNNKRRQSSSTTTEYDEDRLIITEGFENLSFNQREQALAELHGVEGAIEETPALIETALKEFQRVISNVKDINNNNNNNSSSNANNKDKTHQTDRTGQQQKQQKQNQQLSHRRSAYDKACFLCPDYVSNRTFRLSFLRCEKFHIVNAVKRFLQHFETKLTLFGIECLGRDILIDDLDDNAKEILYSGGQWFTNQYDRSGRRIYLFLNERAVFHNAIDYLRMMWYISMVAAEDVQTQRNGVIGVFFARGDSIRRPVDTSTFLQVPTMMEAVPIAIRSLHYCYEDKMMNDDDDVEEESKNNYFFGIMPKMKKKSTPTTTTNATTTTTSLASLTSSSSSMHRDDTKKKNNNKNKNNKLFVNPITLLQLSFDLFTRMKFRAHRGTPTEMKYALISYGIPADSLPLDHEGKLMYDKFESNFLHQRKEIETMTKEHAIQLATRQNVVICPTAYDVLIGRGRPYQDYPGNIRLNQLVELHAKQYHDATTTSTTTTAAAALSYNHAEKSVIVESIMYTIQNELGGRFLKRRTLGNDDIDTISKTAATTTGTSSSSSSSSSSGAPFYTWEIVHDIGQIRRKVSNIFQRLKQNNKYQYHHHQQQQQQQHKFYYP